MKIGRLFHLAQANSRLLAVLLGVSLSFGTAHSQDARTEAFGPAFSQPEAASQAQARVYAYRTAELANPAPINLYLNGRYHASLLRGGYTEFCLSPGRIAVQSALDDASQLHLGKTLPGQPFEAQAARVLYLRVVEGTGRQTLVQALPESLALPEIRRTHRQQHTLSRAPSVQECDNAPAMSSPPPETKAALSKPLQQREYALKTDALFEFGKTELRASGFNAIEDLIQQVHQDYLRIDRIRVLGYTDAIGPAKLNRQLSLDRARTVAERLKTKGVSARNAIEVEGRGADSLVKTHCQNAPTPANKACHAPNRRVVIVVYGPRR